MSFILFSSAKSPACIMPATVMEKREHMAICLCHQCQEQGIAQSGHVAPVKSDRYPPWLYPVFSNVRNCIYGLFGVSFMLRNNPDHQKSGVLQDSL